MTIFKGDTDLKTSYEGRESVSSHIRNHLKLELSTCSDSSIGSHSLDKIDDRRIRRRVKTPVLFIGQLEGKPYAGDDLQLAETLAEEYRALLPQRNWNTSTEKVSAKPTLRRPVRKMKGHHSLRNIVSYYSNLSLHSNSRTLVGSEATITPDPSPSRWYYHETLSTFEIHEEDVQSETEEVASLHESDHYEGESKAFEKGENPRREDNPDAKSHEDVDVGLQICLNLLTNELATAVFQQHTTKSENGASALQIWFMIEAYESIQHHLRQKCRDDQVKSVEAVLNHWLEALYSLYERSRAEEIEYGHPDQRQYLPNTLH
jgi:hypothetical protein